MHTQVLTTALIYLATGLFVAIVYLYVFRGSVPGGAPVALFIAVVGSFLGGVIETAFSHIIQTLQNVAGVNLFPAVITGTVLLMALGATTKLKSDTHEHE